MKYIGTKWAQWVVNEHKNWVWYQSKFNFKTWYLVTGCQKLDRATYRIGTNCMLQPSLGMEIQGIKANFITYNT